MPTSSQLVTEDSPAVSTPPITNQPPSASDLIVVEPRSTAASNVAQAGATQTQSTGFQPSAPQSVASASRNASTSVTNVVLTTGSIVNHTPVAAPAMTDHSTHPPPAGLSQFPTAVPPTVPPTMGNFDVSPPSTFHPDAASTFAQDPTSQTFPFPGTGPPYAGLPVDGGGSYVPHGSRDGCQHTTIDWTTRSSRPPDGSKQ